MTNTVTTDRNTAVMPNSPTSRSLKSMQGDKTISPLKIDAEGINKTTNARSSSLKQVNKPFEEYFSGSNFDSDTETDSDSDTDSINEIKKKPELSIYKKGNVEHESLDEFISRLETNISSINSRYDSALGKYLNEKYLETSANALKNVWVPLVGSAIHHASEGTNLITQAIFDKIDQYFSKLTSNPFTLERFNQAFDAIPRNKVVKDGVNYLDFGKLGDYLACKNDVNLFEYEATRKYSPSTTQKYD